MTPEDLVARYPRLYHMAESGSWPRIEKLGLLTTAQLVDACAPHPELREAVLAHRRATSVTVVHPVHGAVVIRDQGPLVERHLERALEGMTVPAWLHELNTRVFFWLHESRLHRLLSARRYRDRVHDVLVLDTAALLDAHRDRVRLTAMNTGATLFPGCPRRGHGTFMTVDDFPFDERRARPLQDNVVEFAVTDGVPDVATFVLRVERRRGPDTVTRLWERPGPRSG